MQNIIEKIKQPFFILKQIKILYYTFYYLTFTFFLIGIILIINEKTIDYQQNEVFKIIYIHVPLAWLSLILYIFITIFSCLFLTYKNIIYILINKCLIKQGILITSLTIITGSFWGKPTWGTFWVWDARLTTVALLLIFYVISFLIINIDISNQKLQTKNSIFILIGFLNIPIIKYSVEWWNTLHQASSINLIKTTLHYSTSIPLTILTISLIFYIFSLIITDLQINIFKQKIKILKKI
jgi:heme exporter protein C